MTVRRLQIAFLSGVICLGMGGFSRGAEYYCPPCTTCQANVQFYGHYPTRWRPWPGESRAEIHFPQSIGAETIKRPAGESRPELPKETLQPVIPKPRQAFPEPMPPETTPEPQPGPYPPSVPMPPAAPATDVPAQPPSTPPVQLPPQSAPINTTPATGLPAAPAPQPQPQGEAPNLPGPMPPAPAPAQPLPPMGTTPNASPENNPGTTGVILSGPQLSGAPYAARSSAPWTSVSPPSALSQPTSPWGLSSKTDANSYPSGMGGQTGELTRSPKPGPLTITNPTVVAGPPALAGNRGVTQQNKLEISRGDSQPDVMAAPWLPSVGPISSPTLSGRTATSMGNLAQGNAAGSTSLPTKVEASTAATVWAEDTPDTRVAPAGFTAPSEKKSSGMTTSKPEVLAAAATDVIPGLNGYCPVELVENEAWVKGEARFAVDYEGKTYFCGGAVQKRKFQTNPERYIPVCNGRDPVLLVDQGVLAEGKIEHCVVYDGRLYMFSGVASLARFRQNPQHYARIALQLRP